MRSNGFDLAGSDEDADVFIVNTCVVKQSTESKILSLMDNLLMQNKKVVVAGCLPSAYPEIAEKYPFSFIGVNSSDIADAVNSVIKGEKYVRIRKDKNKIKMHRLNINPYIDIIPISEGCVGSCGFCATKLARGRLVSYPIDSILNSVRDAVRNGAKELWITSQDNGCYGFDINSDTNIGVLLNKICDVPGDFMVRVGMMNPEFVLKFIGHLKEVYKNNKIYKFIHIPVQSGSDVVLKKMSRRYSVSDFINIVGEFRELEYELECKLEHKLEHKCTIATDVIVGFPGETEEDFNKTINLIKKIKPDVLNISKFGVRKKTEAEKMHNKIPTETIKKRSIEISKIFNEISIENNHKWMNWKGKVLITEKNEPKESEKESENLFIGRNFAYKKIYIKSNENLLGKYVNCQIKETDRILTAELY